MILRFMGFLWFQEMVMKLFYQGGFLEVVILSGCQSFICGYGLWVSFMFVWVVRKSRIFFVFFIFQSGEIEVQFWLVCIRISLDSEKFRGWRVQYLFRFRFFGGKWCGGWERQELKQEFVLVWCWVNVCGIFGDSSRFFILVVRCCLGGD